MGDPAEEERGRSDRARFAKDPREKYCDLDFPDFEFDVALNTGAPVFLTWH